jgi:hypothetical protein
MRKSFAIMFFFVPALSLAALFLSVIGSVAENAPYVFHAAQTGKTTRDGAGGTGNPFASAFIELLSNKSLKLNEFPAALTAQTVKHSCGYQIPDGPTELSPSDWSLNNAEGVEKRIALVIVISDYSKEAGIRSLPGAAKDAKRLAPALEQAGFKTSLVLNPTAAEFRRVLADFEEQASNADAAIIYTTGHGLESRNRVHLLMGDYPLAQKASALQTYAIPLLEIAAAAKARHVNLVLYGGCRDDPFSPSWTKPSPPPRCP